MKLSYLAGLFLSFFLLSCDGNNKEKEIESLKSEVIGIHDEVMPKMDDIMKLKSKLQQNIDQANDSIDDDSLTTEQNLIINLEKADEDMMVWMRNYDPLMEGMTHEEKVEYLKQTKIDIQMVKQQMLSAISESEAFLEKKE